PQRPPTSTTAPPPTATPPPPPATAPQPLPRAFLATSTAPQRAANSTPPPPPLFTGRPLNPNPSHASPAHGILYPVATSSSIPAAAAAAAAVAANHRRAPPIGVAYPRAHAVAVPVTAPSQQPQAPAQPRSYAAVPRAVVAGVTPRPEHPPRGVPIAPHPQLKVNAVPAVTPSLEHVTTKERESTKENASTVVINDRKVNVLDSESGSLYALCRSWLRNGVPHEIQPSFVGNVAPLLPRPLPASVVDSRMSEKDHDVENQVSEEEQNDTSEYTAADLLREHVTRAKNIRAKLRKERQVRIERYKQRLALLLPPPPPPPSEP
uniref:Uncharacterized protein n=1 Tax=Aegilops tauschii subsp. strangulata TaxID=200361 RepID=A0A453IK01_AEGTS